MNSLLRAYRKDGSDASPSASAAQGAVTVPLPVSVDAVTEKAALPPSRFSRKASETKSSFFESLPAPKDATAKRPRAQDDDEAEAAAKRTVSDAAVANADEDGNGDGAEDSDEGDLVSALPALQARAPVATTGVPSVARGPLASGEASYGPARPSSVTSWYPEVDEPEPYAEADTPASYVGATRGRFAEQVVTGPVVHDISQAALLADQQHLQVTLAHELKGGTTTVMTAGGKRRHQLGKMATEALQNMERLQQEKMQNTKTIGQVRMKVRCCACVSVWLRLVYANFISRFTVAQYGWH